MGQYLIKPRSEMSLRIREPAPEPEPEPEPERPRNSPLDELTIVPDAAIPVIVRAERGGQPVALAASIPVASPFAMTPEHFAEDECEHGRLPGDRTPPCGCWPEEAPTPDLIPDWVLADAHDLHAAGLTYRKIAASILPMTDCTDVPSCEELLKLRLEASSRWP